MSASDWRKALDVRTLWAAHEVLSQLRPKRDAQAGVWLDYYRRSATVYAEVAEVDRGHHHEALYWAARERERASELAGQIETG
jgi:hypothetical protein